MQVFSNMFEWLVRNEGALSALAALAAIVGITYAIIAFIFPSVGSRVRRAFKHDDDYQPAPSVAVALKGQAASGKPLISVGKASIAVLPLKTLSNKEEDIYMAQGISAEIIADLAKVPELRVASHVASFSFQGDNIDLQEVADVLSIRYVLTGSFQRLGNRIHVIIELIDAHERAQMWTATYDREIDDLFAVQDEMAVAIVGAIGGELKLADTRLASSWPTKQLDAWGLVQKAFHFWFSAFDKKGYDESLELLHRAVKIDPDYAGARASLAMILSQRVINAMSEDVDNDRRECLDMIEKAVQLDPNDLTVLANAGLVWTHHGFGIRGRGSLRHAVGLAPLDLIAWGYLAFNLGWTGGDDDLDEAKEILDRLRATAPRHPSTPYWNYFSSTVCARLGAIDEGIAAGAEAMTAQPGFYLTSINLANLYGVKGEHDQAREMWSRSAAINPLMTPEFYLGSLRTICMDKDRVEPLTNGLVLAGILKKDSVRSATTPIEAMR